NRNMVIDQEIPWRQLYDYLTLQKNMVKFLLTTVLLLCFSSSFSQWTRVEQLPSSDIFSLYQKDSILYAGGKNSIYISRDKGQSWDSTTIIPRSFEVDNIIVYKNE